MSLIFFSLQIKLKANTDICVLIYDILMLQLQDGKVIADICPKNPFISVGLNFL